MTDRVGGSPECQLCPICVVLQALGTSRPDVTQHLLAAVRELVLALKVVGEGQVEALDRAHAAMTERLGELHTDAGGT